MNARRLLLLLVCGLAPLPALAAEPRFGGFGEYRTDRSVPCLTDEQRTDIQARISTSISELRARGDAQIQSPAVVSFGWPLQASPALSAPGYHGISNFVDLEPAYPNSLKDYNCGSRTYDLSSGYNHGGIDMFNWPFAWYKMDHDQVQIVAAAPGTIVLRDDGYPDRSCGFGGGAWNAVYVQHADGSVAWYGHMKAGSLTPKLVTQTVVKGEYLGVVGSSGNSTAPHLHFEVHEIGGAIIEPYAGPCNGTTAISWWDSQRPYYDSAVNQLLTHDAAPVFPSCPQQETPNDEIWFVEGQTAYFAAYYRDQLNGQIGDYRVYDANNVLVTSWTHASSAAHYAASYWYWWFGLPSGFTLGWWRFDVTFQGVTTSHAFHVHSPTAVAVGGPGARLRLTAGPNPLRSETRLGLELPERAHARLALFDARGRRVALLLDRVLEPGRHEAIWDGQDGAGGRAPAGVYFASLESMGRVATTRIVVTP